MRHPRILVLALLVGCGPSSPPAPIDPGKNEIVEPEPTAEAADSMGENPQDPGTELVPAQPEPEPEAETETETEPETEPTPASTTDPSPRPEHQVVIETETETVVETKTVIESEPEPEPETVVEPEPETVVEPKPEPEPEPEPADRPPVTYTLTPSGSYLSVLVRYDRSALVAGHDHVLVARNFTGTVTWDPDDPAACRISVTVPARSLVVDPPGSRAAANLEGETPEKDKEKILENALGKSQLNAASHPDLTFRSTGCAARGDKVDVSGVLTVAGRGKKVRLPMSIAAEPSSFSARGSLTAAHADFGMKPFTAALGALRNEETLRFTLSFSGAP